jgi:guanylate kinase
MIEGNGEERIIVFTGPDGSGRKSVAEAVGQTFGMVKVVSYVTRPPRRGEINGQDYHFVSRETYLEMERDGQFLESVEIDGNLYGIRKSDIEELLKQHGTVYLILNREGAERLKEIYGDKVIRLFLYADRKTLEERHYAMGLDEDVIARHMSHYDEEMEYRSQCEHVYGNYVLADTVSRITATLEEYFQRGLIDRD